MCYCNKEHSKERYHWLKEHNICVCCGSEYAERGSVYCLICREDARLRARNAYHKKAKEKKYKEQEAKRKKEAYYRLKSEGRCTKCGKTLIGTSTILCKKCLAKVKYKYKDGYIRSERPNYGRCYICGKHELYSEKLCKECYDRRSERLKKQNENPTQAMIIARTEYSKYFKIFFKNENRKENTYV